MNGGYVRRENTEPATGKAFHRKKRQKFEIWTRNQWNDGTHFLNILVFLKNK